MTFFNEIVVVEQDLTTLEETIGRKEESSGMFSLPVCRKATSHKIVRKRFPAKDCRIKQKLFKCKQIRPPRSRHPLRTATHK